MYIMKTVPCLLFQIIMGEKKEMESNYYFLPFSLQSIIGAEFPAASSMGVVGDRRPVGGVRCGAVRPAIVPSLHAQAVLLGRAQRLAPLHRLLRHHGRRPLLQIHGEFRKTVNWTDDALDSPSRDLGEPFCTSSFISCVKIKLSSLLICSVFRLYSAV